MDLVTYILLGVFAVFVAIMSMRKGNSDRGKDYEQRRDEMYEYYEQRMEEFKATEMKRSESGSLESDSSDEDSEESSEEE